MEISGISAQPAASAAQTDQALGLAVLKKVMETQEQAALALINALPGHADLGQNVNTVV